MKQLQLNGKTLGVVDAPEWASSYKISNGHVFFYSFKTFDPFHIPPKLPMGDWKDLGRLNDITEEQAAGLVEEMWNGYKDYDIPNKQMAGSLPKAFESLQSFFRSHGIEGNPLVLLKKTIMTKNEKKKALDFAAFITDVAESMKKHKVEDMLCVFKMNGDVRNTYIPLSEKGEMELFCKLSDGIHEWLQSVGFIKSKTPKHTGKLPLKKETH